MDRRGLELEFAEQPPTLENMLQNPSRVCKKWGQDPGIFGAHAPNRKGATAPATNRPDLQIDLRSCAGALEKTAPKLRTELAPYQRDQELFWRSCSKRARRLAACAKRLADRPVDGLARRPHGNEESGVDADLRELP